MVALMYVLFKARIIYKAYLIAK